MGRGKRRIEPLRSKTDNASSVQLSNPTEAFLVGQYPELVDGEVQLVSSSNRGRVGRFRVMIFSKAGGNGGGALVDQGLIGSPQVLPPNPSRPSLDTRHLVTESPAPRVSFAPAARTPHSPVRSPDSPLSPLTPHTPNSVSGLPPRPRRRRNHRGRNARSAHRILPVRKESGGL